MSSKLFKLIIISFSMFVLTSGALLEVYYLRRINKSMKKLVHNSKRPEAEDFSNVYNFIPKELSNIPFGEKTGLILGSKKIDIKEHKHAYNPSIVKNKEGGYILFYRDDQLSVDKPKNSLVPFDTYIYGVKLDENFDQASKPFNLTSSCSRTAEDPRAFQKGDDTYIVFNDLLPSPVYSRGMHIAKFDEETMSLESRQKLNFNIQHIEKNWTPMSSETQDDSVEFIYKMVPHISIEANIKNNTVSMENMPVNPVLIEKLWPKKFGPPRGGSPAISLNDDEYIAFFQSHFVDKQKGKTWYVMGAYTFEKSAPHKITSISKKPIIFEDMYDTPIANTACGDKRVIYPSGVVFGNLYGEDVYYVTCGENDCGIKLVTISKQKLLQNLRKVKVSEDITAQPVEMI
ncbi:MAG: hypothetical protein P0S95_00170 [Rhabdochlamydiaceae bacterium]|nr:hypothetical protein [Candidatus Amphrikana amoebophyrae]